MLLFSFILIILPACKTNNVNEITDVPQNTTVHSQLNTSEPVVSSANDIKTTENEDTITDSSPQTDQTNTSNSVPESFRKTYTEGKTKAYAEIADIKPEAGKWPSVLYAKYGFDEIQTKGKIVRTCFEEYCDYEIDYKSVNDKEFRLWID